MELLNAVPVILIMVFMTALYFVIGYRFLKKHRGKKNADN